MKALAKRLDALEVGQSILSPRVKQWLGWELTDAERTRLDNEPSADLALDAIDPEGWSGEAKAWLGVG